MGRDPKSSFAHGCLGLQPWWAPGQGGLWVSSGSTSPGPGKLPHSLSFPQLYCYNPPASAPSRAPWLLNDAVPVTFWMLWTSGRGVCTEPGHGAEHSKQRAKLGTFTALQCFVISLGLKSSTFGKCSLLNDFFIFFWGGEVCKLYAWQHREFQQSFKGRKAKLGGGKETRGKRIEVLFSGLGNAEQKPLLVVRCPAGPLGLLLASPTAHGAAGEVVAGGTLLLPV